MSDGIDDVRRVLTIAFRENESLNQLDLERFLALDMEWIAPHEAEEAVQQLVKAGWIRLEQQTATLAVELGALSAPLGWFPRPSRLLNPPHAVGVAEENRDTPLVTPPTTPKPVIAPTDDLSETKSHDPRSKLTARLAKFIARSSGLDKDEVERRVARKQHAFLTITPWLAYALVGREQGMAMQDIVDALAVV